MNISFYMEKIVIGPSTTCTRTFETLKSNSIINWTKRYQFIYFNDLTKDFQWFWYLIKTIKKSNVFVIYWEKGKADVGPWQ